MERLNLNLPTTLRRRLRGMAKKVGRPESVVARQLLAEALDRAERDEFYRLVASGYTPAMRKRDLLVVAAFEKLDE